jgi:hypothetical protein
MRYKGKEKHLIIPQKYAIPAHRNASIIMHKRHITIRGQ